MRDIEKARLKVLAIPLSIALPIGCAAVIGAVAILHTHGGAPAIQVSPGKLARLQTDTVKIADLYGKAKSMMTVVVRAEASDSEAAGQVMRLIATVSSRAPASRIDLAWQLPEGVLLRTGRAEDSLLGMDAGETREIEVTVLATAAQNRQIGISASQFIGEERFVASAQIETLDQPRIDKELALAAKNAAVTHGEDVVSRISQ